MSHKRSRNIQDKIKDCLDNSICNLHPDKRNEMMQILLCNLEIAQNVAKSKSFLSKKFNIPESGKGTIIYWLARGWSKVESKIKMTPYLQKQKVSPGN